MSILESKLTKYDNKNIIPITYDTLTIMDPSKTETIYLIPNISETTTAEYRHHIYRTQTEQERMYQDALESQITPVFNYLFIQFIANQSEKQQQKWLSISRQLHEKHPHLIKPIINMIEKIYNNYQDEKKESIERYDITLQTIYQSQTRLTFDDIQQLFITNIFIQLISQNSQLRQSITKKDHLTIQNFKSQWLSLIIQTTPYIRVIHNNYQKCSKKFKQTKTSTEKLINKNKDKLNETKLNELVEILDTPLIIEIILQLPDINASMILNQKNHTKDELNYLDDNQAYYTIRYNIASQLIALLYAYIQIIFNEEIQVYGVIKGYTQTQDIQNMFAILNRKMNKALESKAKSISKNLELNLSKTNHLISAFNYDSRKKTYTSSETEAQIKNMQHLLCDIPLFNLVNTQDEFMNVLCNNLLPINMLNDHIHHMEPDLKHISKKMSKFTPNQNEEILKNIFVRTLIQYESLNIYTKTLKNSIKNLKRQQQQEHIYLEKERHLLTEKENHLNDTQIQLKQQEQEQQQMNQQLKQLQEQNQNLNKQISQLDSLKLKYDEALQKIDLQQKELTYYHQKNDDNNNNKTSNKPNSDEAKQIESFITQLQNEKICLLGGYPTWSKNLQELLPNIIIIAPDDQNKTLEPLKTADRIIINTSYLNHGIYYKAMNVLKQNKDICIQYQNTSSSNINKTIYSLYKDSKKDS